MCIMPGVGGSLDAVVMSEYLSCVFSLRRSAFSWATGPRLKIEGALCVLYHAVGNIPVSRKCIYLEHKPGVQG